MLPPKIMGFKRKIFQENLTIKKITFVEGVTKHTLSISLPTQNPPTFPNLKPFKEAINLISLEDSLNSLQD